MILVGKASSFDLAAHFWRRAGAAATGIGAALLLCGSVTATPAAGDTDCARAIERFQVVIDSDVDTGNLNRSVYVRMSADLKPVKAACAAGRNGEAESRLGAVRARYGYH